MNQGQIEWGDRVNTRAGIGTVIHPKDNPQDDELGDYRSDSEFIHVLLDNPASQAALHGTTFTTLYAVYRRENVTLFEKAKT